MDAKQHVKRGPDEPAADGAVSDAGLVSARVGEPAPAPPGAPLSEHLFRRESARMVAALTRIFGVHNLSLAEEVVQDAFCRALEVWRTRGVPEQPAAWLMTAAKHRAIDVLRRERTARTFAPELGHRLETEQALAPLLDSAFAAPAIRDEQLRMMFSCCHPRLPEEAQLALVLHILCGFGVSEIGAALLTGRAAIEKRISRGKHALAAARHLFDLGGDDLAARLSSVQRALYLLFNEGYHGASAEAPTRTELCGEALRLVALLRDHPRTATPSTAALAALLCLHAARLPARIDAAGELAALADQDRSRWDARLTADGLALLEASAAGAEVTPYHLEAAIAAAHASARSLEDTDWAQIVALYDRLLALAPSPVAALSRAVALGRRDGPSHGLAALRALPDRDRLAAYPVYAAALGELELLRGDLAAARGHLAEALRLARNDAERRFLERRLALCALPAS